MQHSLPGDLYIGGRWVRSASPERLAVFDPATEQQIASVPAGAAEDVDQAVTAARAAFPAWADTSPAERSDWLLRIGDVLDEQREEVAHLITREMGAPLAQSRELQVGMPLHNFRHYADLVRTYEFDSRRIGNSLLVREPIGVVGCITPWNFPLHQIALKVAPALAAGCTVVLKPSELAPLTAYWLAEIADRLGLPAGVLNVVSGLGTPVGEAIATHPDVDMVSFTGSTRAGTRVAALAAPTVKKVGLELGGKSANIILEDADLEPTVVEGVKSCYLNAGQNCAALARMIVPKDRLAEAEQIAADTAAGFTIGDPFDERTMLGPVISDIHLAKIRELIASGIQEGATLLVGGPEPVGEAGHFVGATVFSRVTPDMRIAREEIFGPVLAILTHEGDDDAVRIANDTDYGLYGAVHSADDERAMAVARRLRAGQVGVNGGAFNPKAPFGGYKRSGLGREAGEFGLEEFLEVKAIHR